MKLLTSCALCALTLCSPFCSGPLQADPPGAIPEIDLSLDIDLSGFGAIPEMSFPAIESRPELEPELRKIGTLDWHVDYTAAYRQAREEQKMLFIFFRDEKHARISNAYVKDVLASSELAPQLGNAVRVILPLSAAAPIANEDETPRKLLSHKSFKYMYGREGLAIVDLTDPKSELHGQVVSAHPFTPGLHYTVHGTKLVLELPRGSVTQRALIYAVRIHPAAPISTTEGKCHDYMCKAAHDSSQLMANYGSVGHHDWGTRQGEIAVRTGRSSMEVAAMSGNQTLLGAAAELVDQWYGSPAHWGIMSTPAVFFGYDIVRDAAGKWWGTGVFAN